MSKTLPAGTPAPDFTLLVTPDQTLSLRELRGRPVILAFYPADCSPVFGDQMALYNEGLPEFHRFNAELLGISVDGVGCHAAFPPIATSTFRCSLTSNPNVPWRISTERSATEMDSPSALSSSSIRTGQLPGVISPP
jgi:peroxiredoxin